MIGIILLLFLLVCGRADNFSQNSEHVCNSIDIKANSIEEFEEYENCTVIEGYVQILFIEHNASVLYFPKIKEITGYLLLYRVLGVFSLKNIFPNLSVIRGDILFFNYSFILYEMLDLQEIGLGNLTNILHGSIRIEKNPSLCYVNTIDWDQILSEKRRNIIRDNRPNIYCPNKCQEHCPFNKKNGKKYHLCWSLDQCQKSCKEECKKQRLSCSSSGDCCHAECLGGCTGSGTNHCVSCKNVVFNGRCLKKCPFKTFEYLSWRCLSENECRAINTTTNNATVHWKPFEGMCICDCPPGYMEDKEHNSCQKCGDHCPKVCPETTVDSILAVETLRGCTHINGSLNIVIKGERNIIQALEENLKTIQVIDGFLKVARSFPLISLNFLKSLHTIHGNVLYDKKYSFAVFDNDNLQDLWNCENCNKRLEIKTGGVYFHLNPKLCIDKINALKKYAHIPDWDDRDISKKSNGHKIPCHVIELNVSAWKQKGATTAGFDWRNCRNLFNDSRSILGYVSYYRKAPVKNITILDGRDACGVDGWELFDIAADADGVKEPVILGIVTHLQPYTQYAMYIQTLTISSSRETAQSPIIYFKTCPDTPGSPINVQTHTVSESVVIIIWQPPKQPNGNVTHYMIEVVREHDPSDFFNQRNYCHETFSLPEAKKHVEKKKESTTEIPKIINDNNNITLSTLSSGRNDCCPCTTSDSVTNVEYQPNFENHLQHVLYTNNSDSGKRVKRSVGHSTIIPVSTTYNYATITNNVKETTENSIIQSMNSSKNVITPTRYNYRVEGKTRLNISDLHHFTEYTIKIQACHSSERPTGCSKYQTCSTYSATTVRTLAAGGADDINETNVNIHTENSTLGSIFFTWKEPKDPNGLIVSYHIEYRKMDDEPEKVTPICITQSQYRQYGGYQLVNLLPGNYSFRLMAVSLAGNGNWTSTLYFVIPENTSVLSKPVLITVVVTCVIVLLIFIMFTGWFVYKKKTTVPEGVLYASVNPEYISAGLVYEPDEWEVDRENISLIRELGQGSFGMVYEGEVKNFLGKPHMKCAIKTINESASHREKIEFLQEASVMKAFHCFYIIKLLGVVSKGHPVFVVMELMANGDLKSYLRSHRPEENPGVQPPTLKRILQMAIEIADGMAYLANKKFVHRDLAARNCMVAENLTVKIGDFGMTRDVYETDYYRKGGKGLLPVRWMAPESLQDGVFTTHSDVWSYGIVLWEMATLASQPYQGLSNEQVLKYVTHGGTIEKPVNCPDVLYQLMRRCWVPYPENRPTFIKIIEDLLEYVNTPEFQKQSFYFSQLNVQDDNADTTTSMLRSPPNENTSLNSFDTEMDIYYFPGTAVNRNTQRTDNDQSNITADNVENGSKQNCGDGSKGISVTYSDDSQGSKVSNISNGSVINGHIYFPSHRTTMC